ncbi:MAG: hypothetical protein R3B93_13920 [Bacteroidia bacterium]
MRLQKIILILTVLMNVILQKLCKGHGLSIMEPAGFMVRVAPTTRLDIRTTYTRK